MRSTLLLASLLAVVPFISATPARRDGPVLVYDVKLSDGTTFVIHGCHKLWGLHHEEPLDGGEHKLTVKTCLALCHAKGYHQGGVGNRKCFCDSGTNGGTSVNKSHCKKSTCLGDSKEFCGSSTSYILYERKYLQ